MITLFTGKPGSAKTLSAIVRVIKERKSIEAASGHKPDVYYSGIKIFKTMGEYLDSLDPDSSEREKYKDIPRDRVHPKWDEVKDWKKISIKRLKQIYVDQEQIEDEEEDLVYHSDDIKKGSIFIVDEAQFVFPQRQRGEVPPHVKFLTVHRHSGFNYFLITQESSQIDKLARQQVQYHLDFERIAKTEASKVAKSSQAIIEDTDKDLVISETFTFPKSYYCLYKSAEFHTQSASFWSLFKNLDRKAKFMLIGLGISLFFTVPNLLSDDKGLSMFERASAVEGGENASNDNGLVSGVKGSSDDSGKGVNNSFFSGSDSSDQQPTFYLSHYMSSNGHSLAVFDYVFPDGSFVSLNEKDLLNLEIEFKKVKDGVYFVNGQLIAKRPYSGEGTSNEKDSDSD